jgi:hypothetical protein
MSDSVMNLSLYLRSLLVRQRMSFSVVYWQAPSTLLNCDACNFSCAALRWVYVLICNHTNCSCVLRPLIADVWLSHAFEANPCLCSFCYNSCACNKIVRVTSCVYCITSQHDNLTQGSTIVDEEVQLNTCYRKREIYVSYSKSFCRA